MSIVTVQSHRQHELSVSPAQALSLEPIDPRRIGMMLTQILSDLDAIKHTLSGAHKSHYTVDEVARLVGRSAYTVRRWITDKRISATRIDGTGPKGRLLVAHEQLSQLIHLGMGDSIPDSLLGK